MSREAIRVELALLSPEAALRALNSAVTEIERLQGIVGELVDLIEQSGYRPLDYDEDAEKLERARAVGRISGSPEEPPK
jgi:hypothetical protein